MALGCPINDVLDFGGHFLSLDRDSFFKRGVFQQPTRTICERPYGLQHCHPQAARASSTWESFTFVLGDRSIVLPRTRLSGFGQTGKLWTPVMCGTICTRPP